MSDITYSVAGGDLPVGTEVGSGIIGGVISWENLFNAPTWVTPAGNLGTYAEDTPVPASGAGSIPPFQITLQPGSVSAKFSIVNVNVGLDSRGLPWGLLLNPNTGLISGRVNQLLDFDAPSFLEEEAPIWDTKSGQLGNFGEKESVSIFLLANGQLGGTVKKYSIKSGGLPWGLVLNKAGFIGGTTAPTVFALDDASDAPTGAPVWSNAPGLIAIPLVGDNVSVQFTAAPTSPATKIVKYTMLNTINTGSGLPWGLTFSPSTGLVSGKILNLKTPLPSELYVWPNGPLWSTPEGSLGDVGEQRTLDVTLAAPAQVGTFQKFSVWRGALPWGLTLNIRTGRITGITAPLNPGTEPQEPVENPPVFGTPLLVSGTPTKAGSGNDLGTFSGGSMIQFDIKATLQDATRTMVRHTVSAADGSAIPLGLTYNTKTGRLGGTLRGLSRKSTFTVVALDSAGATSKQTFTITVA
jgi:hypothetical protein